jgi:hypothetical protein
MSASWEFPFAKPRFILRENGVFLANTPLPSPDTIFASRSITDLPYLQYEPGYRANEWEWHPFHRSFLVRWLFSRFPAAHEQTTDVSEETLICINRDILLSFVKLATMKGARRSWCIFLAAAISRSTNSASSTGRKKVACWLSFETGVSSIWMSRLA